jgi:hypothetical protein
MMQFSPASCHFIPLRPKYSPQHHFLNILSVCVLPKCERPHFTHTQKNTGKIIILYILIVLLLAGKTKDSVLLDTSISQINVFLVQSATKII